MKIRQFFNCAVISMTLTMVFVPVIGCARSDKSKTETSDTVSHNRSVGKRSGGPQLGQPGGGPAIDKSGDSVLQAMIKEVVPRFRHLEYEDAVTGKIMKYNLLSPEKTEEGKSYPLVLFMADASTPGENYDTPLVQGYGALVWGTKKWQAEHPCFVLVPQFSGVAVNDEYQHTDEVDIVIRLVKDIAGRENVDTDCLYTTGQSMGGMISMYYNITYPNLFAASLFVDCHWDTSLFGELAKHKFVYVTAGNSGHSWGDIKPLEAAAEKDGVRYEYAQWSARLPQQEQDSFAIEMLAKGAPVNIINFTPKSVLPADGKGSEHMYSFDYAYRLTPVLEWVFRQKKLE